MIAPPPYDYATLPIGYYDTVFSRRRGIQSKWHHIKFDKFRAALRGHHRHLDIACGPGTFIGTLDAEHASTGVDIAAPQIEYARATHPRADRQFQVIAPGALPFPDAAFDAVTLIELIEHLERGQAIALLAEARRVVKPGGVVLVSTPNYASAWPAVEYLLCRFGAVDYTAQHINKYDRHGLSADLRAAGFTRFDVSGYMLAAPFTAALGWRTADLVEALEPGWLKDRFGLLLFARVEPG